jgi:serum resistance protein
VKATDSDIYRFAAELRGGKTFALAGGGLVQPYAKAGVEEQFSDGGALRVSTGDASERLTPDTDGTRIFLGAGVAWQMDKSQQVHLDLETSFGDKYDIPWSINAGYRVRF